MLFFFTHFYAMLNGNLPPGTHLPSLTLVDFQTHRDARAEPPYVQVQSTLLFISSGLLLRRTTRHALELPRVFPRHARLVPRAFAALPEAVAFLADETGVAEAAVFGAVVLLAGACVNFMSVASLGWWRVAWFRMGSAQGRAFGLCHGMGWSLQKPL